MGVYVKGNPKEGEYKLIKTTDGFVLEGKDIAYACIEIDLIRCEECEHWNDEDHWCNIRDSYGWDYKPTDFCSYGDEGE